MRGTRRTYDRSDYPWADFSKTDDVTFDQVFAEIGLDRWLNKDSSRWNGLCPFHFDERRSFVADNKSRVFRCNDCSKPIAGNVQKFVIHILGLASDLHADIWLLQFDPSQNDQVSAVFGRDLMGINARAREQIERKYDSEGYRERMEHARLLAGLVRGTHDRLLGVITEVLSMDPSMPAKSSGNLREYLYQRACSLTEQRSHKH